MEHVCEEPSLVVIARVYISRCRTSCVSCVVRRSTHHPIRAWASEPSSRALPGRARRCRDPMYQAPGLTTGALVCSAPWRSEPNRGAGCRRLGLPSSAATCAHGRPSGPSCPCSTKPKPKQSSGHPERARANRDKRDTHSSQSSQSASFSSLTQSPCFVSSTGRG